MRRKQRLLLVMKETATWLDSILVCMKWTHSRQNLKSRSEIIEKTLKPSIHLLLHNNQRLELWENALWLQWNTNFLSSLFTCLVLVTVLVMDSIFFLDKGNKIIFLFFFTKKHKGNNLKKPNNFNSFVQREIKEPSQLQTDNNTHTLKNNINYILRFYLII